MKATLFSILVAGIGCTDERPVARGAAVPDNAAVISVDPIQAPSAMSKACGTAGYTVDDSSTPLQLDPTDRDRHDVTFHCNDGSKPIVTRP